MIYKNADRTFLNEKWRYRAPASGGSNQYRIAGMQTRLHQAVAHSVRIQRARRAVCRLRFLCLFLKYDVGLLLRTLSKHAKRYPVVYSSVLVTLQKAIRIRSHGGYEILLQFEESLLSTE